MVLFIYNIDIIISHFDSLLSGEFTNDCHKFKFFFLWIFVSFQNQYTFFFNWNNYNYRFFPLFFIQVSFRLNINSQHDLKYQTKKNITNNFFKNMNSRAYSYFFSIMQPTKHLQILHFWMKLANFVCNLNGCSDWLFRQLDTAADRRRCVPVFAVN